jgi:lipid A 4'-phosphatase
VRFFYLIFAILLALPVAWPQMDLYLSSLFYEAGQGFSFAQHPAFQTIHFSANLGARVLGVAFAVLALASWGRHKKILLDGKAWLFLLVALVIGPGLVANAAFKDHWGRSRPREIVEFGGKETFSSALTPRFENARSNGSFVCGDGAFGFLLPAAALVVPLSLRRRVFWGGMAVGAVFSFARLAMGAHFFSDIVYAAFMMLASSAVVFAAMYGRAELISRWRSIFKASTASAPEVGQQSLRPVFRSGLADSTGAETPAGRQKT